MPKKQNIHFILRISYIKKRFLRVQHTGGPSNVDTDTQSSFYLQRSHKALLQFLAGVNSAVQHKMHYNKNTNLVMF